MTQTLTAPVVVAPAAISPSTRTLLRCGIVAGPIFAVVAVLQIATRDGFDLRRLPISALSLGGPGWIQIANFVVTGLLSVACAVGLHRASRTGPGRTWGPILVGGYGAGMAAAGVFTTDPAYGFPAGAPAGMPDSLSWHAIVHGAAAPLAFLALTAAALVFARRYRTLDQRRPMIVCLLTALAIVVLSVWPDQDSFSIRIALGAAVTFGWLAVTAARLLRSTR